MIKRFFSFLALSGLILAMPEKAPAQMEEATTIILMRHAEKENGKDPDPDLSAAGKQRAQKIATLFKDVQISHLLTTPYKRTRQTLEPLATARGLGVDNYDPSKTDELLQMIREAKGQTLVIAGHSNTVPELINLLLGEKKYEQIKEDDFGKVWVITICMDRVASCMLLNTN